MKDRFRSQIKSLSKVLFSVLVVVLIVFGVLFYFFNRPEETKIEEPPVQETVEANDQIESGIDPATGFVEDEGMQATIQNCTACHSAKLVTQNRMSREGWEATIKWMQETQNLWDLGTNKEPILTYLSKNYAPTEKGRRQNLEDIEWYELE
ncbi:MAG: monoheme cytochrome C [Allomuricauda sp.]